jgi:hypothetical protein
VSGTVAALRRRASGGVASSLAVGAAGPGGALAAVEAADWEIDREFRDAGFDAIFYVEPV